MSVMTLGGFTVISATLSFPRIGAWHIDAVVDTESTVSGAVTVSVDTLTLSGTVVRSSAFASIGRVRVVGGAGQLGKTATPKYYRQTPIKVPLLDVLNAQGETLSTTADATILSQTLPSWTTTAQATGRVIGALVQASPATSATATSDDAVWRVLNDGTIWIGRDNWAQVAFDYALVEDHAHEAKVVIESEMPTLQPGTTLTDGRRISYVESRLEPNRIWSTAYLEAA